MTAQRRYNRDVLTRRCFGAALLGGLPLFADTKPAAFSSRLWGSIKDIYAQTLRHPFLTGLTDGTLPRDRFDFYLKQDSLYLVALPKPLAFWHRRRHAWIGSRP